MKIYLGFIFFVSLCLYAQKDSSYNNKEVKIKEGIYVPLYVNDKNPNVKVEDFYIDVYPVTNEEYLDFVKQYPKWKKSKSIALFADKGYLNQWESDDSLKDSILPNAPVTSVSWYAAKAYCESKGKRLPSVDEWEYVAMASEKVKNAQRDSLFNLNILRSYEKPKTYLNTVGSTYKNYWGVYDMHGLIWEWTSDFNSVMISSESRERGDKNQNLFCAGGAVNASNLVDYATFMRYAFRASLKADYCVQNLGFRCAKNIDK